MLKSSKRQEMNWQRKEIVPATPRLHLGMKEHQGWETVHATSTVFLPVGTRRTPSSCYTFLQTYFHQKPRRVELRSMSALQVLLDRSNPFFVQAMGWFKNYVSSFKTQSILFLGINTELPFSSQLPSQQEQHNLHWFANCRRLFYTYSSFSALFFILKLFWRKDGGASFPRRKILKCLPDKTDNCCMVV